MIKQKPKMTNKANKRGQITIFIIIALALVSAISLFFIFRERIFAPTEPLPPEAREIPKAIQECLEFNLVEGTILVGLQGGYTIPPDNAIETNFSYISYGYYLGKNTLPLKEAIEKEISFYLENAMLFCINLDQFPGIEIELKNPKANTKISPNSVKASLNFPIVLTKENSSSIIDEKYSTEYKVRLYEFYNISQEIISKEIQNPELIEISYLTNLNYDVSILPYEGNTIVYTITNIKINETENEYTFRFANKLR